MLALLSALVLQGQQVVQQIAVPNPNILLQFVVTRLEPPKMSPKLFDDQRWEFDWLTRGYGAAGGASQMTLRVRVYSQERRDPSIDKAPLVAREAMQLWDRCYRRLRIDSPTEINNGDVDFFLCFGGKAGGEQLFGQEVLATVPTPVKVNTIYIYDLSSFKDPVEMAREVAHEYGHAILPAIGGFKQPEVWANGALGEKLFLTWLRDDMVKGAISPADAMGASKEGLDAWVKENVDPLVTLAATRYPDSALINESAGGMDGFLALAMYAYRLCPPAVFVRSLAYTKDAHPDLTPPVDYPSQLLLACSETEELALAVPPGVYAAKQKIWIPLGKGSLKGGSIVSRKNGWAEVLPLQPNLVIKNPPPG